MIDATASWDTFERLPASARDAATARLAVLDQVASLRGGGMKAADAVAEAAAQAGVSPTTIWNWLRLVEGVPRANWLAALAPLHRGRTATAQCDPRAWDFLVADYLRPEAPSFAACYRRLAAAATANGWSPMPASKTLQRRLEKTVPAASRVLARQGVHAVARLYPHQTRDRSGFAAMQAVNADGHRFDVFVRFEDGSIGRPVMAAIQDLASGMVLGHRLGETENWSLVRLAVADMVTRFGIPEVCYLDNGPAFASKWLTGGQKSRFRFTIKAEEPEGILTQLGIKVHWAMPYHGQSKPIERAFRDLCEEIAKHPAVAGAYTGNAPDAKPENYQSRAIPMAEFRLLVAQEIARHNARKGRRGNGLNGRSFAEAFERSLALPTTVVTKATAAQRRMLLLAAEGVTCRKPTGEIQLGGNRYWSEELVAFMGRTVTVRFDPDDLHAPVAIYARDGRMICEAPAIEATGFADIEQAKSHARNRSAWVKGKRQLLALEQRLGIDEVARLMPRVEVPAAPRQTRVVRLAPNPAGGSESYAQSFSRAVRALEGGADLVEFPGEDREAG